MSEGSRRTGKWEDGDDESGYGALADLSGYKIYCPANESAVFTSALSGFKMEFFLGIMWVISAK